MYTLKFLLNNLSILLIVLNIFLAKAYPVPDSETAYLSQPNREFGLERFLGLGVVVPYPYFQKPRHRYPVYDRSGRGYLAYGYGGPQTYRYTEFNPVDGHH